MLFLLLTLDLQPSKIRASYKWHSGTNVDTYFLSQADENIFLILMHVPDPSRDINDVYTGSSEVCYIDGDRERDDHQETVSVSR